jgi:hypothetical protein
VNDGAAHAGTGLDALDRHDMPLLKTLCPLVQCVSIVVKRALENITV